MLVLRHRAGPWSARNSGALTSRRTSLIALPRRSQAAGDRNRQLRSRRCFTWTRCRYPREASTLDRPEKTGSPTGWERSAGWTAPFTLAAGLLAQLTAVGSWQTKPDGSFFEGNWSEGRKHGVGYERLLDNSQYRGEFADGQKHGHGALRWSGGASYSGEFLEDTFHGEGVFVWADGRQFRGQWAQNRMHGMGRFEWPDGKSFEGKYENDKKHGPGVFSWPDGSKSLGLWQAGKQDGQGTHDDAPDSARRGRLNPGVPDFCAGVDANAVAQHTAAAWEPIVETARGSSPTAVSATACSSSASAPMPALAASSIVRAVAFADTPGVAMAGAVISSAAFVNGPPEAASGGIEGKTAARPNSGCSLIAGARRASHEEATKAANAVSQVLTVQT